MKLTDHKNNRQGIPSWYLDTLYIIFSLVFCTMGASAQTYVTSGVLSGEVTGPAEYYHNTSIALNPGFHANGANGTVHVYISGCVPLTTLPSSDQNYVMTTVPRVAVYDPSATGHTTCDAMQIIQYIDGLGRPLQTVQVKGSSGFKDVVQPFEYDVFGREVKKYLPYTTAAGNAGSYRADALQAGAGQASFYTSPPSGVSAIANPFAQTVIEPSPLNRVLEQGAPGAAWQPAATRTTTGRTVVMDYTANNNTAWTNDTVNCRQVALYTATINADGSHTLSRAGNTATYDPNMLTVNITKDENWTNGRGGTTETYTDKENHVVLKRTFNYTGSSLQMLSTYYVYDDLGHLAFVLPPGASPDNNAAITQATLDNLCYQYQYDERGRPVKKKLPGKGWEFTIYNTLDQVVATQDANQRHKANQDWTFVRYDALGRTVMTGIYQYGAIADQDYFTDVQAQAAGFTTLWESYTGTSANYGYTSASFPASSSTALSVTYYDGYGFAGTNPYPYSGGSAMTKGLTTGTLTNVLGTSDMLMSVHYYDDKGRNIKTFQQHYLGGNQSVYNYDELTTSYNDFTSEVTGTDRKHYTKNTGNTAAQLAVTIDNGYAYDHMGRKIQSTEQINGPSSPLVTLSQTDYNEVGQVWDKKLHSVNGSAPLQTVNYTYNERGWLTGLNSTLFQEYLQYNDVSIISNVGAVRQYNGNIASQSWGSAATGINHDAYVYLYDNLNRLTSGNCTNGFSENNISYDLMGNIKSLYRYQPGAVMIDQLAYNYTDAGSNNTNQLQDISDATNNDLGLKHGAYTYAYDLNGNMKTNNSKGLTVTYNMLNLPQTNVNSASGTVTYTYDATGKKLRKTSTLGSGSNVDYIDGIQYANGNIDFAQTEEGRVLNLTGTPNYEYTLKDHLGNNRATFDSNSGANTAKQQEDYYPFGLESFSSVSGEKNEYLYNGKELQEELGQYDYGARFYDPVIGRFSAMDRFSEKYSIISPYQYGADNPIKNIDVKGDSIYVTANLKKDSRIWDSFETLKRTPEGRREFNKFARSTNSDIYVSKEYESDNSIEYTYADVRSKGFVKDNEIDNTQMADPSSFYNLNGHKIKGGNKTSIIGFNTSGVKGLDKYELAFSFYHELVAHIDGALPGDQGGQEHENFGNYSISPGLGIHSGVFIDGEDYNYKPNSPAWNFLKQLLKLKIDDGNGTEENKNDLKEMNNYGKKKK